MQIDREFPSKSGEESDHGLTPKAQVLLNALRAAEDWLNRSQLAQGAKKTALNKWDLILLDKLLAARLIEMRQRLRHGPIGYEWQYRAVKSDHDAE